MRFRSWLMVFFVAWSLVSGGGAHANEPASDFTLRDIDGNPVSLSSYKGNVVVLSFWATWCGPCKEEMPHLEALHSARLKDGLVLLSISTDDARTAPRVGPYIRAKGYTFPVLLDKDGTVQGVYNPTRMLPWTVVIDRNFEIAKVHAGYNPGDEKQLALWIDELLAAPTPGQKPPEPGKRPAVR